MYHMKNIISHDCDIILPKCMYHLNNIYNFDTPTETAEEEVNINVRNQMPNAEMADLQVRQDLLLKKLDILYDRIKTISSICTEKNAQTSQTSMKSAIIEIPEEVVLVYSPDCLPWFLKKIIKEATSPIHVSWHIHSTVPSQKVPKIQAFVKSFSNSGNNSKVHIRLIFKNVSADPELKLSSLEVPIVGNVNILRYLSLAYPTVIPYDCDDYNMDNILDICHILERTTEKNKEALAKTLFTDHKNWIYQNKFSILDAAAFNVLKQWQNGAKYAPKDWFSKCEKIF